MPELAEVEFYRKRWALPGTGALIRRVHVHADRKVFRGTDASALQRALTGRALGPSQAAAKQMLFRAGENGWLGIHLGLREELFTAPATHSTGRHDHLVLFQDARNPDIGLDRIGAGTHTQVRKERRTDLLH